MYRRKTPLGNYAYMVANYSEGKRRFDSYATEAAAMEAATKLAKQLSEREVLAAAMTNEQASEYAASIQKCYRHFGRWQSKPSVDCFGNGGCLGRQ